jgi:hypothetical protein
MNILAVVFMLLLLAIDSHADDCNVDCNASCCKTIRITPWDKNTVCDPQCKLTCEASKKACQVTGGVVPPVHTPSVVNAVVNALEDSCAAGFQVINNSVILYQGPYAAGSEQLLNRARDVLVQLGLFSPQEFANVTIRWGRIVGGGQAPDRNLIFIDEGALSRGDLLNTTITLAHEMVHVRQYRRMGTDSFKCEYSKAYVRCGCQNGGHPLEAEAYAFERQVTPRIQAYLQGGLPSPSPQPGPPPPMGALRCSTPIGICPLGGVIPLGAPCYCPTPRGPVWGYGR